MPESAGGSNIELAHHLSEHKEESHSRAHEILEIVEAIVLAMVAVSTAWSGYQAALWTGHQQNCTDWPAGTGSKPKEPPPPPIRSVCTTPPPWSSG